MEPAPPAPASEPGTDGPHRTPRSRPLLAGVGLVAIIAVVAAGLIWVVPALTGPGATPGPSGPGAGASEIAVVPSVGLGQSPTPSTGATRAPATPALSVSSPTQLPGPPLAASGSIVAIGSDGALSLVEASGRQTPLTPPGLAPVGFPAWSPDGSRIAAVQGGTENTIVVFDAARIASGEPVQPQVIFRSATIGPFYLSWTPDSKRVSFLADGPEGLSLRIAPTDGSAPLDGSGPGAIVETGQPFYYDWIEPNRLFAHVGTGSFAFLGEIALGGAKVAPDLKEPGDFRSAVVSRDRSFVSYAHLTSDGTTEIVVAARDGSSRRTVPVFGMAAVAFNPMSDTVATIGPTAPPEAPYALPLGPLRLIDGVTGKVRVLLDGTVVSFWWSPDGKTIAALRVQRVGGASASASAGPPSSSTPGASAVPETQEVRLLMVDVASGEIRTQAVVQVGQLFIDQFLTFFDQYALSHRLWAPDSSSILLPVVGSDGGTRIALVSRNGDPPRLIDGIVAFWSP